MMTVTSLLHDYDDDPIFATSAEASICQELQLHGLTCQRTCRRFYSDVLLFLDVDVLQQHWLWCWL